MPPAPRRPGRPLAALAVALLVGSGVAACSSDDDQGASPSPTTTTRPTTNVDADVDLVLRTDGEVVATVDERFHSYNVEMVEVTGGEFWQPYDAGAGKVSRPPIDLASERLRNLARALGPAYIRVSGSWANFTFFDPDGTAGDVPPEGFDGLLTGEQWIGVGEFARAIGGQVTTSFASNDAVRNASGEWQGDQARALLAFSVEHDIPLVAAELFNEPGLPIGMPDGYDAATYAQDVATFLQVVDEVAPDLRIVGPGATADAVPLVLSPSVVGEDLAAGAAPRLDAFSYHFYPKVSERCGSEEGPEIGLTEEYLARVDGSKAYYEGLRDEVAPGAPMWITEIAQAACGGDRWAATYRDILRYVDTLGRLSTGDGDVVFHNTLAASDYALIDEDGFVPRPNYWAAVLWTQLMGPQVLAAPIPGDVEGLTVYARCHLGGPGVAYALVNVDPDEVRTVSLESGPAEVYLLTGDDLDGTDIALNGTDLVAHADGTLPDLTPESIDGAVEIPAASVAYVVDPSASTATCP